MRSEEEEEEFYAEQQQRRNAEVQASQPTVDLLACQKCKQFGHLSFQCLNMFTKDGRKDLDLSRGLLTSATEPIKSSEEEAKERMLTEKATELM